MRRMDLQSADRSRIRSSIAYGTGVVPVVPELPCKAGLHGRLLPVLRAQNHAVFPADLKRDNDRFRSRPGSV